MLDKAKSSYLRSNSRNIRQAKQGWIFKELGTQTSIMDGDD